ncbi:MAG: Ig domain-containing protein [Acidimicrobiales bacterium]
MFSRRAAKAAVACAAASAAALASLTFSGVAAATGPAKGTNIPGAAAAVTPFTAGQTFDSGQKVNIVIPANTVLNPNQKLFILECGAPGGVDPMTVDDCDGNTGYASGTISTNSDGSVNLSNAHKALYPIYALPDHFKLGETSSAAGTCGLGSANECVLYIGQGGGSDLGFSQPYYFSQPFQVHPDATDSGTVNPGDGTFPADSAPVITSASSATFTEGSSSSFTVTASGWPPPTIAESGALPAGVTFDPGTDVLSGTPTVTGTFPISFDAGNGVMPDSVQSFNLTVSGPAGFQITTASLPNGVVGQIYDPPSGFVLQASGAAPGASLKWKKVLVPKGLKVKAGVLEGTVSKKVVPGNVTVEIQVTEKYKVGKTKFVQTVHRVWTMTIT